MIEQKAADVLFDTEDAIINDEFHGFKEDYLVLHSLIRRYKPKTFCEIGTNLGRGTAIIANAGKGMKVYSLDLPTELAHISLQHPINEGHGDKVGSLCTFPYTQLRGDSMEFDFSLYPCEGYYIDGEHSYENVSHEIREVLKQNPKIIAFHDSDISEVWRAITDANNLWKISYNLFRVSDTRISYFLVKS